MFLEKIKLMEHDFKTMHEQLNSEIKLLSMCFFPYFSEVLSLTKSQMNLLFSFPELQYYISIPNNVLFVTLYHRNLINEFICFYNVKIPCKAVRSYYYVVEGSGQKVPAGPPMLIARISMMMLHNYSKVSNI